MMNTKLNGRTATLPHLAIPPSDGSQIPFAGNKVDASLVLRCLRNASSSSPALRYNRTPLKVVDDDVLVMDGVLVSAGGSSSAYSASASSIFRGASRKNELCRSWEDANHCLHSSKCQFAHGKEEVRPVYLSVRRKYEASKPQSSTVGYSSFMTGPRHRLLHMLGSGAARASPKVPSISAENSHENNNIVYINSDCSDKRTFAYSTQSTISRISRSSKSILKCHASEPESKKFAVSIMVDWSPLDDGIDVTLPGKAGQLTNREELQTFMNNFSWGPSNRNRLPVFSELTDTNEASSL